MKLTKKHIISGLNQTIQAKAQNQASKNVILQAYKKGTIQLQAKESSVTNTGQEYQWGDNDENSTIVGQTMEAYLNPKDPLTGEASSMNKDQDEMMSWIRTKYGLDGNQVVKGHLLNDNLGGKALNVNLFPITGVANKTHLNTAENLTKNKVWSSNKGVYYSLQAKIGNPSSFNYEIYDWDPNTDKTNKLIDNGIINSYLDTPKKTKNEIGKNNYIKALMTNKDAVKKNKAFDTNKNQSDLEGPWEEMRNQSGNLWVLNYTSNDVFAKKLKPSHHQKMIDAYTESDEEIDEDIDDDIIEEDEDIDEDIIEEDE